MLFGKNSDRQPNEAQALESVADLDHAAGTQVACTYITIPQARRTHAVLLSRPFWTWGAEMGANEHGVVIGNEGVNTRAPAPREAALIGMDLVRLGLERGATAAEAVEIITELLERHGQGGNCGHLVQAYYNNSFMVADSTEAYVLETIGREWLLQQVRSVRAISNAYSIGRDVQRRSTGLAALIHQQGWSEDLDPDYAAVLTDPGREHIGNARAREACSMSLLRERDGELDAAYMMQVLRNHGHGPALQLEWTSDCTVKRTVCMHAGTEERRGQTVASMVSELRLGGAVHWVTGTAAPCVSIFKPVLIGVPLPDHGPKPTDRFDAGTLWWRHERLHRMVLAGDFGDFLTRIRAERDALEADFRQCIGDVLDGGTPTDQARVVAQCWSDSMEMESAWIADVPLASAADAQHVSYLSAWHARNQLAHLPTTTGSNSIAPHEQRLSKQG